MSVDIVQHGVETKVFGHAACIVAEYKFINVFLQMLIGHGVIDADYTTFQKRPKALNAVGVNIVFDIFASTVVDVFVLKNA
jgi:hypothetical protein